MIITVYLAEIFTSLANIKMFDLNSLIGFSVLGVIGWLIYKVHIWPYYISPLRKIPGPPSENPFYGNIKRFLDNVNIDFLYTFNNVNLTIYSLFY